MTAARIFLLSFPQTDTEIGNGGEGVTKALIKFVFGLSYLSFKTFLSSSRKSCKHLTFYSIVSQSMSG